MIPNSIAFSNDKGGVGKTTIAANVAGLAASSGWVVLLIDTDPQGDLALDLGVEQEAGEEGGAALAEAVFSGRPLNTAPLPKVRPNLDFVPAGSVKTREMREILAMRKQSGTNSFALQHALSGIVDQYDLIAIDTPPNDPTLQEFVLGSAHYVVAPTKPDLGSMKGIARLGQGSREFGNPHLELLGVALFGIGAGSKVLRQQCKQALTEFLGDTAGPFEAVIRHAEIGPVQMRENGWLAVEHERELYDAQASRLPWWEARQKGIRQAPVASNATGLREDYVALATEIMNEYTARMNLGVGVAV